MCLWCSYMHVHAHIIMVCAEMLMNVQEACIYLDSCDVASAR